MTSTLPFEQRACFVAGQAKSGTTLLVALLDSQFTTLEEPGPDERPIVVDIGGRPAEIVSEIVRQLEARARS